VGWGAPRAVTPGPEVVAVFGPTGSGKTSASETVAHALDTEIVSADALQVYRGLPILTNQPERATRLVAIRDLSEEFSVGEYAPLAHAEIDELVEANEIAVLSGGTGLYLRAALVDLELPSAARSGARARWEAMYDADPVAAYARLGSLDAAAASRVHLNDRRRVVRALELAEHGETLAPARDRLWAADTRLPTMIAGLEIPRLSLERRIRERTEEMLERGVVDEARRAVAGGISKTAEKALGLRDLVELPLEEARERLVARTLRYAAYQRKWMRRIEGIVMIDADRPPEEVADAILEVARAG
jgi:tRNA dimethylallyltransferase